MNDDIDMLANLIDGLDFPLMHSALVEAGETPFQENLKALKAFDIRNDRDEGVDALKAAIKGIDEMIKELELYRDAAKNVSKQAVAVIRSV